ncbi:MAG: hypothetical protein ABFC96_08295 [Thermoguttaceae bacterium]
MNAGALSRPFLRRRPWQVYCAALLVALCVAGSWLSADRPVEAQEKKKGSPLSQLFDHDPPVVTGRVGWYSKEQAGLEVDSFQVEIIKEGRVITGTPTRVKIHVAGEMQAERGNTPYVKEVFLSERLVDEKSPHRYVDVLVAPILDGKTRSHKHGYIVPFDVAVEYKLYGYQWDDNRYLFHCADKTVDLRDVIRRGK